MKNTNRKQYTHYDYIEIPLTNGNDQLLRGAHRAEKGAVLQGAALTAGAAEKDAPTGPRRPLTRPPRLRSPFRNSVRKKKQIASNNIKIYIC